MYNQVLMTYVGIAVLLFHSSNMVLCLNVSRTNALYSGLFNEYNIKLLPLTNQSGNVEVGVLVYLLSLNTFDELSGELSFTALFNFRWKEERLTWSPEEHGGKTSLLVSPDDIWKPKLFVRESFETLHEIGIGSEMLQLAYDGVVVSTQGAVLKVTCPVDVTFFPFDTQNCAISLTTLTVTSAEVIFRVLSPHADVTFWKNNSQWIYINSSMSSFALPNGPSGFIINISLKRRSEFYIIYIVVPLVFLGGINNLVFTMPASSGERSSVAITSFLAFAVYMQIINNNVPQSSSPIAYIYYYLMFLLIYSSYIMLFCIVSMRIHDRKDKVPLITKYIVIFLRYLCCKRRTILSQANVVDKSEADEEDDHLGVEVMTIRKSEEEITWALVGKTFDQYISCINFLVYWSFTGATFCMLYANASIISSWSVDNN